MKPLIIINIVLLLFIHNIQAQTTTIPDPNFEQALITLGIDSDNTVNGQLLNSDATSVTALDISYNSISNLKGIEAFTNLDTFICNNNTVDTVDLSNNSALTFVQCLGSQIQYIDVTNSFFLKKLEIAGNSIDTIDLTNNFSLEWFDCTFNYIRSLNLIAQSSLRVLFCSSNQLSALDLSNCFSLQTLFCDRNQFTTLDLSPVSGLIGLGVRHSQLTSLDLSQVPNLHDFFCEGNNWTSLDLSNNPKLRMLECQDNQLTTLDLSNNSKITRLECQGNNLSSLNLSNNSILNTLDCSNNQIAYLDITNNQINTLNCEGNLPYLSICVTNVLSALSNPNYQKDLSANYTENCNLPFSVRGRIVLDQNNNCTIDSAEVKWSNQLIRFANGTDTLYAATNDSGYYQVALDTGSYTATLVGSTYTYLVTACPLSQQVTVDTSYSTQIVDFVVQATVYCPHMQVDIAAPLLRVTRASNYTVQYCNRGTATANNAYVEVTIDADLNVLSSTVPVVSQVGNVYTFNIGKVEPQDCGSFLIEAIVSPSAIFQQTHCTEAHIYPDSICAPFWSGPIVQVAALCQNDTVRFNVQNVGAAMLQAQPYWVFEDNVIMRTGTVQLGANQQITIHQRAAVGSSYRIEVQQLSGFPQVLGDPRAVANIEGCNPFPNGSFNTGFITQLSNGSSAPHIAIDCQQNVGSYDPNDKAAQPEGYGINHYIEKNTVLDYKVRFQNTGTDTAFNVVILDTLSPYVDLSSLRMGASSHEYTWTIESGNVLQVSFANIMLPDSNVNEPLSHGFFRYRIAQRPNNPVGTIIENTAGIYFDYNPVVLTNTTFHTIGENFIPINIVTSAAQTVKEDIAVKVYPNPFQEQATLAVIGGDYEVLQLKVYDITGRVTMEYKSTKKEIQLQRGNLPQGVYIYRLEGDGELINTGKVIISAK